MTRCCSGSSCGEVSKDMSGHRRFELLSSLVFNFIPELHEFDDDVELFLLREIFSAFAAVLEVVVVAVGRFV